MPTADTSVSRSHRDSSLTYPRKSGFDSIYTFDTSSKVHLRSSPSYTPDRFSRPFPTSLTTIALYNSRTGRFDSSIGWPKPRDLLSSLIQHGKLRFPSGHTRVGNGFCCPIGINLSTPIGHLVNSVEFLPAFIVRATIGKSL